MSLAGEEAMKSGASSEALHFFLKMRWMLYRNRGRKMLRMLKSEI